MISCLHSKGVFPRRKRVLVSQLSRLISDHSQVLDVGSGDGTIARAIRDEKCAVSFHCIDVLVRPNTAIPVERYDGVRFPAADCSRDYVLFVDVLHHTPNPQSLLNEAARVSRKHVIIKDHNKNGILAESTLRFMDWVGNARFGVSLPYNYWTSEQWADGYKRAGLKVVEKVTDLRLYPFWANWIFGRDLHSIVLLEKL